MQRVQPFHRSPAFDSRCPAQGTPAYLAEMAPQPLGCGGSSRLPWHTRLSCYPKRWSSMATPHASVTTIRPKTNQGYQWGIGDALSVQSASSVASSADASATTASGSSPSRCATAHYSTSQPCLPAPVSLVLCPAW